MKHEEFNPVLFEEAYDALLERYNEYQEGCPKRRSAASDAQKKAKQAGEAPKKQAPRQKPEVARKPDSKPKRKKSCRTPLPTYSETLDFTLCRRPDGSTYGTAGRCIKGVETESTREEVIEGNKKAGGVTEKVGPKLDKLDDEQLANVAKNVAELIGSDRGRNVGEMEWKSVKALDTNREKLMEGYETPSKLTGKLKKISDEEADAFYSLLPSTMRSSLNKAGGLSNTEYLQEDGSHGKPTPWRGRQLAKRWLEQDGKDLYTGLPLRLVDADMEHIIPHKIGKNRSESLDNFGWVHYATNQRKSSDSMERFFSKKVDKPLAMGEEKYTKNVYGKARAKADKNQFLTTRGPFYSASPKKITEEAISQFGDKLYYVSREWGVKHGFKKNRASTRYFSEYKLPGTGEKFTEFVVRRWGNATPKQRAGMVKISEFVSTALTNGIDTGKVMTRAAQEMKDLGLE